MPTQTSNKRKRDICPKGMQRCSVLGERKLGAIWECVDTQNDVESCEFPTFAVLSKENEADAHF